jgi:predicted permease
VTFLKDVSYGIRQLRKTPGFTVVCVLTLALGIGANTAVFSVMNAVLLKSLPVSNPQEVVYLNTSGLPHNGTNTGNYNTSFSYPVYDTLRRNHPGLSEVIAYVPMSFDEKVAVRYGPSPETAKGDMVGGNFFSGLGVRLERGRGFTAQDEDQHAPVTVISYNYWTRRFSRNPDVIGKTLYIKSIPFTIVGISAEGFEGTEPGDSLDFWIPMQSRTEFNVWGLPVGPDGKTYLNQPNWWCLRMLARIAPGVSKSQALAQIQPIFQHAAYIGIGDPEKGEKPPVMSFKDAKAFPGYDEYYGEPLKTLMGMVSLVLLIALSNVAMLLMARNATRQREFSLRLALGAGCNDLFRQLLTEGLLLVATGGLLAWLFAVVAAQALGKWAQIDSSLAPDTTVLLVTLAVLVIAALVFGLAPLRIALAGGPANALKVTSSTSNTDAGKSRTGKIIVALQMALCVVLLVGAGLLGRTLRNLQNTPLGMRTDGLVVFGINPQNIHSFQEGVTFYQELTRRLRVLPGVESVALMGMRPGSGWSNNFRVHVDGKIPPNGGAHGGEVRNNWVGPDAFHTLGVSVIAGREFTDADTASSPKVVVINETFAKRYLPNENPIGHHVGGTKPEDQSTIIGVVKDHKFTSVTEEAMPMYWEDYTQGDSVGQMHVEMRVHGDPLVVLPAVRKAVQQMNPDLPLIDPQTQQAQFEESISQQILFARLGGFFGLLAVVLVTTGLYGTLAYRVNNRTVEIGVRMAVGAQREQIVWMVLRDSLVLTAIGLVIGIPLAAFVTKTLSSALFGVKVHDVTSYGLAIVGVVLVALVASVVPARKAASVDPLNALRAE